MLWHPQDWQQLLADRQDHERRHPTAYEMGVEEALECALAESWLERERYVTELEAAPVGDTTRAAWNHHEGATP